MTSYTVFTLLIILLATSSVTPRRVARQVNNVIPAPAVDPTDVNGAPAPYPAPVPAPAPAPAPAPPPAPATGTYQQQPPNPYYPYGYPPPPYPYPYPPPPPPQPSYYPYPPPPQTGYPPPPQTYHPAPPQAGYPAPTQTYYPAPTPNVYPAPAGYYYPSGTATTTSGTCSGGTVVKNNDGTCSCVKKLSNGISQVQNLQRPNEMTYVYPAQCKNHSMVQLVYTASPTVSTQYIPNGKAC